ncbi:MAG: hypothetical protein LBB87_02035 [Nitrososphaerota archaeon]|jgi:hypothetical protein|nr:hypothetical protein [Nitrososphaerota archaeon]
MVDKNVKTILKHTCDVENVCEDEPCLECGGTNILHDEISGELVCRDCGLVLETVTFTAPADRIPKHLSNSPLAYTSVSVGTEIESYQRLELSVAYDIERLLPRLELPNTVLSLAVDFVRRLRSSMRHQQTDPKIRFTRTELIALSVWAALKQLRYPINCNEYSQRIERFLGDVNLMKLEKRATPFIETVPRISDVKLVAAHINRLVNVLENFCVVDGYYSHVLGKYAIEMVYDKQNLLRGRRSDLIAASAVFAADGLIAEHFSLRVFAEFANVGAGNLSVFTELFKRSAPPVPKESAAICFVENLFRGLF